MGKIKRYENGGRVSEATDIGTVRQRDTDAADDQAVRELKNNWKYVVPEYKAKHPEEGDFSRKNRLDSPRYTISPLIRVFKNGGMVKAGSPKHTAPCADTKTVKC